MSSIAPTPQTALALGPLATVVAMLFGGFYVNLNSIPVWIRWFSNCSPIKWGFIGLAVNEFSGGVEFFYFVVRARELFWVGLGSWDHMLGGEVGVCDNVAT